MSTTNPLGIWRKRWPWVILFVVVFVLITTLLTTWNYVLVQSYLSSLKLKRPDFENSPWLSVILGSTGFVITLSILGVLFAKFLREMKLNLLQREFLANITHELKTPLATLELSASLLEKTSTSDEERRELWIHHNIELKRLREEIQQLLMASKLEHYSGKPRFQDLDLSQWTLEQEAAWRRILGPQAELKIAIDPHSKTKIQADPDRLSLVVRNFVDNARKFSKTGEVCHLKVSLDLQGQDFYLRFSDEGLGFEAKESKKIFKRFYRASHKTQDSEKIPGTGLGLHLALFAARSMNMDIEAQSPGPGLGSSFVLSGKVL